MNEKLVEDSNELDVMRRKNAELESEVLESRKMNGELENQVSELIKLNEKLVEDNKALDELRGKVRVLEGDKSALVAGLKIQIAELDERVKNHLETISEFREVNSKLADEYTSLWTKYRQLQERELKLKEDTEHLMNVDASGGNNEWEPRANPMVADFVDVTVEDVLVNVFGHDTVEATPLRRNEDVHDTLGVSAGTQPRNIGGNDDQGASSASGKVKLRKDSEIIIFDADRSVSQRVHGKKTIIGLAAVKDAYPGSSVATQQKSKFTNAVVDTAKRKFSFPDIDTSSDDSSDDSFFDKLPISSALSQGKKTKM
ncbi:hypothetical protein TSUD_256950 [Trifolium subterraneum]|uniref:Uncharacterized protein n=1 Tax=Trifolium subterraneum TaxID=3900 RepID=A0A2Z6NFN9_TRISU|nr:hypothetical protein TSUD_256950 [Trifolium subterraneum]